MQRSLISSRPKTSPSPSAALAPAAVLLRTPQTPQTPPPQTAEVIVTLIATVTVVVVAVAVVVVVDARSLMLDHGWMAVLNVARDGCAGKHPTLAFHGLRCRSKKSRRSWSRSVMLSRRHEMMNTWKRPTLVQLMLLSQMPAQAWQHRLHHHPQPRAAARPSSCSHHSRIHPHQPLYGLLSERTQGVERRWGTTRAFFRSFYSIVPFHFHLPFILSFFSFFIFGLLCVLYYLRPFAGGCG